MPLEAYQQYRPSTPEAPSPSAHFDASGHNRNVSDSSTWSSPNSVISAVSAATRATTPNASPAKQTGPNILPRIRTQDQNLELNVHTSSLHRRAQSHDPVSQNAAPSYRPSYQRSTTSPPEPFSELAPVSATSTLSPWVDSAAQSPLPFSSSHAQTHFGHGRSLSASIDSPAIRLPGNPFYRTCPVYITHDSPQYSPAVAPPILDDFASMPLTMPADPSSTRGLTPDLIFQEGDDFNATTTQFTYLTEPNPTVFTIGGSGVGGGGGDDARAKHFWWDVRNIRPWDDFNLDIISTIPGLSTLLNVDIKATGLPTPAALSPVAASPENLSTLANTIKNFHIAKVNAALHLSQGYKHNTMTLRTAKDGSTYFLSAQANEETSSLSPHPRVIGLVKPYEAWNSGKRQGHGLDHIKYLQGLAHLQLLLRQHNCRYGFIITEIEIVCVRLGTEPFTPHFGLLELSRPIAMNTHRTPSDSPTAGPSATPMTACLALWYLNMLASNTPLEGQCGWRISVGPPEALSRAKVLRPGLLGRDEWMPRAHGKEVRDAKRNRGWTWPEEPVQRVKEGVVSRRGGGAKK